MSGQPGVNVQVIYKAETFGTPQTGAGGEMFRIQPGAGLTLNRTVIRDPEVRKDGMTSMVRLGSKSVSGSYPGTLSVGTFNTFLGALFRHAWAADTTVTYDNGAAHTSVEVTTASRLVTVGTGSLITDGVRVGDVIRLANMSTAANNSVNCIVSAVAANQLDFLGTPLTIQGADNACTLTIKKKLKNALGTIADPMVRAAYTIEEYFEDLDESEQYTGCRVSSLKLSFQPDSVVKVEFGIVGQTMTNLAAGGTAPGLTTPTEYTSIGLIAADASIYLAGSAIATITGGEITFDLGCKGQSVVGSLLTPDVYEGPMTVTGQLTAIRTAIAGSHLARYLAETDNVELSLLFVEPDAAAPIDFFHVFLPRIKYTGDSTSLGDEGALIETIPFEAHCKATTTGYDSVVCTISTSA